MLSFSLEEKQVLFISESTQVPRRGVVEKDFKLSRQKNVVHQEPDPWKIQGGLPHLPHLLLGHQGEKSCKLGTATDKPCDPGPTALPLCALVSFFAKGEY